MCVCWGLSSLLPCALLPKFELAWPFPSRTKTQIIVHTLRHFPVMQQNNFNPDITVSGYAFADDCLFH